MESVAAIETTPYVKSNARQSKGYKDCRCLCCWRAGVMLLVQLHLRPLVQITQFANHSAACI